MKDGRHHLKHVQKKAMRSVKKEEPFTAQPETNEKIIYSKRPKTILKWKKNAL